jgi:hypothetical protein
MAILSASESEWNERAKLFNYHCRNCKQLITFDDQELYFRSGLCTPCLAAKNQEVSASPDDRAGVRLEQIRSRGWHRE